MIAWTWGGVVRVADGPAHVDRVAPTGMHDCLATQGNRPAEHRAAVGEAGA